MGEAAIRFWEEEEGQAVGICAEFEDVALLSTGIDDALWMYGSD